MDVERPVEDVLIAGAGPIGLACAVSAKHHGADPLVIDAGAVVNSIVHYPIGMTFFTTPDLLEIGGHPLACAGQKPTREEALKYYRGVVRAEGLRVRPYTTLAAVTREQTLLRCDLRDRRGSRAVGCRRLVLATGYYDHPNLMGVEGEQLPHVSHRFDEAHRSFGLDVVVIGGKNSAIEAALELFRAGARVTLVYRRKELKPTVKYWLKPDFENRLKAGEIAARLGAEVLRIDESAVVIRDADGREERLAAARVYALTGYHPDFDLFRRIGIRLDEATGRPECDGETLETNVPGVYMAGSITAGRATSEVFIENGRFDGERIFAAAGSRNPGGPGA
ncbi:MAG TPA: YpdA family putative bacillithiol disulfide reductase [Gemmatimonadales bacterium]|nr:YpdA family putative bacillithiol disulfide reductase [Gemmatimonadales bacterium]